MGGMRTPTAVPSIGTVSLARDIITFAQKEKCTTQVITGVTLPRGLTVEPDHHAMSALMDVLRNVNTHTLFMKSIKVYFPGFLFFTLQLTQLLLFIF